VRPAAPVKTNVTTVRAVSGASFYAPVEGGLRELERRLLEVGRGAHPVFRDAVAHLFTTPGKLLRPTLVFLSSRFGPGEDREVVLNLAESLELVHTASLVHDDVVDRAQMRRNIQTVNAKWNDDVALIVGDYLFAKAYALAAVLPKPEVIAIVAQRLVRRICSACKEPYTPSVDELALYQRWGGAASGNAPGAAVGRVILDADKAETMAKGGERVILVRPETSPDDFHGMSVAEGILTARGGMTSHAAVVARGMGKPCIVGAEGISVDLRQRTISTDGTTVKEGDFISIDGATALLVNMRVSSASPTRRPLINSSTRRAFWGDTRWNRASALNSC